MACGVIVEDNCYYCDFPVFEDEWIIDESIKNKQFLVHKECMKKYNRKYYDLKHTSMEQLIKDCFDVGVFKK